MLNKYHSTMSCRSLKTKINKLHFDVLRNNLFCSKFMSAKNHSTMFFRSPKNGGSIVHVLRTIQFVVNFFN